MINRDHWAHIREYILSKEIEYRIKVADRTIDIETPVCCDRKMLRSPETRTYKCIVCGTIITDEALIYGGLKHPLNISLKTNSEHIFKHNAIARKDWFK